MNEKGIKKMKQKPFNAIRSFASVIIVFLVTINLFPMLGAAASPQNPATSAVEGPSEQDTSSSEENTSLVSSFVEEDVREENVDLSSTSGTENQKELPAENLDASSLIEVENPESLPEMISIPFAVLGEEPLEDFFDYTVTVQWKDDTENRSDLIHIWLTRYSIDESVKETVHHPEASNGMQYDDLLDIDPNVMSGDINVFVFENLPAKDTEGNVYRYEAVVKENSFSTLNRVTGENEFYPRYTVVQTESGANYATFVNTLQKNDVPITVSLRYDDARSKYATYNDIEYSNQNGIWNLKKLYAVSDKFTKATFMVPYGTTYGEFLDSLDSRYFHREKIQAIINSVLENKDNSAEYASYKDSFEMLEVEISMGNRNSKIIIPTEFSTVITLKDKLRPGEQKIKAPMDYPVIRDVTLHWIDEDGVPIALDSSSKQTVDVTANPGEIFHQSAASTVRDVKGNIYTYVGYQIGSSGNREAYASGTKESEIYYTIPNLSDNKGEIHVSYLYVKEAMKQPTYSVAVKYQDRTGTDIFINNMEQSHTIVGMVRYASVSSAQINVKSFQSYVLVDWTLNGTPQGNTNPQIINLLGNAAIVLVYGQDKGGAGTDSSESALNNPDPGKDGRADAPDNREDVTMYLYWLDTNGDKLINPAGKEYYVNIGDDFTRSGITNLIVAGEIYNFRGYKYGSSANDGSLITEKPLSWGPIKASHDGTVISYIYELQVDTVVVESQELPQTPDSIKPTSNQANPTQPTSPISAPTRMNEVESRTQANAAVIPAITPSGGGVGNNANIATNNEVAEDISTGNLSNAENPLGNGSFTRSWSLANLIVSIISAVSFAMVGFLFVAKKYTHLKGLFLLHAGLAASTILLFILTSNIRQPMVFVNKMTVLFVALAIGQAVVFFVYYKRNKDIMRREDRV